MKINDRIEFKSKARVLTFKPEDMVIDAVMGMAEKNYGASVITTDDNIPVGIITERDFMRRLLAKGLDPKTTPISKIMTSDLKLAYEDDLVVDWLRIMSNERFRHLPVIDRQGHLLNLMSQGDFVSYTWPQLIVHVKDAAIKSFMDRFHLHLIISGIMIYTILMILVMRAAK